MVKKLDDIMAALPKERRQRINARTMELATLKDLRQAAQQTQEQLAATLGVGQDSVHHAVDAACNTHELQ